MSTIFLPGRGDVDLSCRRVDQAVNGYDERLFATRHPATNVPTVFIRMSPFTDWLQEDFGVEIAGHKAMPLMAFEEGFPEPHIVIERLYKADSARRGTAILQEITEQNASIVAQAEKRRAEAAEELAEVVESFKHRNGLTPYHRSLRKRDPKQRG